MVRGCRSRGRTNPGEVFERDGSDAMRWFLMASPILRSGDLLVTESGIRDAVREGPAAAVEQVFLRRAVRECGERGGPHADGIVGRLTRPGTCFGRCHLCSPLSYVHPDLRASARRLAPIVSLVEERGPAFRSPREPDH